MRPVTFIAPIKAGKAEAWRKFAQDLSGPRKAEWLESNKRLHLSVHRAWLQHLPSGDHVVVQLEGQGASDMMPNLAASKDPFDVWFRKQVEDIHGFDLSKPPTGPLAELLIDYNA